MKHIKTIIILSLLFGFASVYSQQSRTTVSNTATKSTDLLADPKLSPEQQQQMLNAGDDNPSKIDPESQIDPKMDPDQIAGEEDYGESNARPDVNLVDPKQEDLTKSAGNSSKTGANGQNTQNKSGVSNNGNQSEGIKPENVTNYRNVNGPNSQPKGEDSGNVTNYRDMNGPNDQPTPNSTKDPKK